MKKSLIEKYKPLWEGAKSTMKVDGKIAYNIMNYCVTKMTKEFQAGGDPNEKGKLVEMINKLKEIKDTLPPEALTCSEDDYRDFLQTYFQKIDNEDRKGTVTAKTVMKFRLMSQFIDVLTQYGPLDDEMKKCKKYCGFKAVDIHKSLKKGEVPRRGGPGEGNQPSEDQALSNELEGMIGMNNTQNNQYNNVNNNNQFNQGFNNQPQNQGGFGDPFNQGGRGGNINNQGGFSDPFGGNQNNNNNKFNTMNSGQFSDPFGGNQNQPNTMQNRNNNYGNQNMPGQNFGGHNEAPKTQKLPNNQFNTMQNMQNNNMNNMGNNINKNMDPYGNNNQNNPGFGGQGPTQTNPPVQNPPPQQESSSDEFKLKKVAIKPDYGSSKICGNEKYGQRKPKVYPFKKDPSKMFFEMKSGNLCLQTPVRPQTIDYFILMEGIKKTAFDARREIKKSNFGQSYNMVQDALEYLSKLQ